MGWAVKTYRYKANVWTIDKSRRACKRADGTYGAGYTLDIALMGGDWGTVNVCGFTQFINGRESELLGAFVLLNVYGSEGDYPHVGTALSIEFLKQAPDFGLVGESNHSKFIQFERFYAKGWNVGEFTTPWHRNRLPDMEIGASSAADLLAVFKARTSSGNVEIEGLSAAAKYKYVSLRAITRIPQSEAHQYRFYVLAGGDVMAVKTKAPTASGNVEVSILRAKEGYANALQNLPTSIPIGGAVDIDFGVTENEDLIAVLKHAFNRSGKIEVARIAARSIYRNVSSRHVTPWKIGMAKRAKFTVAHNGDVIAFVNEASKYYVLFAEKNYDRVRADGDISVPWFDNSNNIYFPID